MFKLMKLEIQKFEFGKYMRNAFFTTMIILALVCLVGYVEKFEGIRVFTNHYMVIQIVETLIRAAFIIFASVLLLQIVINEFKNKTISVLFLYPINRKKIIAAKLLIIILFTFFWLIVSFLLVMSGFYLFNHFMQIIPQSLSISIVLDYFDMVLANAVAASLMSIIPLYFGMKKYSASTTILSSFFVALIVCQQVNGFTLNSIIFIPITLAVIGALVALIAIRSIEEKDVPN